MEQEFELIAKTFKVSNPSWQKSSPVWVPTMCK